MAARWGDLVQQAGDDAAVLDIAHGARLVASTDTSVEGVHFRREWLSLQEIGYRATIASLSDLAAMAADPIGLLIAATIPAGVAESIEQLADGIGQAARDSGCPIVGGDLTGGDRISLTMTVLARPPRSVAPEQRAETRSGSLDGWEDQERRSARSWPVNCRQRNTGRASRIRLRASRKPDGWPSVASRR
jgi:thiamine monophosphate kinase